MLSGSVRIALVSSLLLWGSGSLGQGGLLAGTPPRSRDSTTASEEAARRLAESYLQVWSEPNALALASAPSFYGPVVKFHGETRTLESVLAEKRRFAERWPQRVYRHLPRTTQIACKPGGTRCIVRSSFNFAAANPGDGRRSLGVGEHELVVSLSGERPVIVAEDSRVVLRGHGNMSALLGEGL
jgi:hypothetical protein